MYVQVEAVHLIWLRFFSKPEQVQVLQVQVQVQAQVPEQLCVRRRREAEAGVFEREECCSVSLEGEAEDQCHFE